MNGIRFRRYLVQNYRVRFCNAVRKGGERRGYYTDWCRHSTVHTVNLSVKCNQRTTLFVTFWMKFYDHLVICNQFFISSWRWMRTDIIHCKLSHQIRKQKTKHLMMANKLVILAVQYFFKSDFFLWSVHEVTTLQGLRTFLLYFCFSLVWLACYRKYDTYLTEKSWNFPICTSELQPSVEPGL